MQLTLDPDPSNIKFSNVIIIVKMKLKKIYACSFSIDAKKYSMSQNNYIFLADSNPYIKFIISNRPSEVNTTTNLIMRQL